MEVVRVRPFPDDPDEAEVACVEALEEAVVVEEESLEVDDLEVLNPLYDHEMMLMEHKDSLILLLLLVPLGYLVVDHRLIE